MVVMMLMLVLVLVTASCMSLLLCYCKLRLWQPPVGTEAHVINLPDAIGRMANFTASYRGSDLRVIPCIQFRAVDTRFEDVSKYLSPDAAMELSRSEHAGHRSLHHQLSRGAVGCALSHMQVWGKIAASPAGVGVVFEDDAVLNRHAWTSVRRCITTLPGDWDILLLGCSCGTCSGGLGAHLLGYQKVGRFYGTHAYVITSNAASRLMSCVLPMMQQIDSMLSDLAVADALQVYRCTPQVARQAAEFRSQIQTPIREGGA